MYSCRMQMKWWMGRPKPSQIMKPTFARRPLSCQIRSHSIQFNSGRYYNISPKSWENGRQRRQAPRSLTKLNKGGWGSLPASFGEPIRCSQQVKRTVSRSTDGCHVDPVKWTSYGMDGSQLQSSDQTEQGARVLTITLRFLWNTVFIVPKKI